MLAAQMVGTLTARRFMTATGVAVLVFLAVTVWWLTQDGRMPDADSAGHMGTALEYRHGILHGDPWGWFTRFDVYPPLVRLIGALAASVGGIHVASFVVAENLIFVPLLALGCYGAASVTYGPAAGALAAIFALGSPMVVSLFHVYLLDAPEAALAAVAVWMLLASRRFTNGRWALGAGVAVALGMMTKSTFVVYVAGLVAVMLLRGGWRQWRSIALFLTPIALIAGPWYLAHLADQGVFANGVAVAGIATKNNPTRYGLEDLAYYLWAALNQQYHLVYCLLAAAGAVVAAVSWRRGGRGKAPPELIAGLVVGWLVTDGFAQNDPRYTLPLIVYVAVLACGPLLRVRARAVRLGVPVLVVGLAAAQLAQSATGDGPSLDIALPGAAAVSPVASGHVTVLGPQGYLVTGPKRAGDVTRVLRGVRRAGVGGVGLEPEPFGGSDVYTGAGVTFVSRWLAGLRLDPSSAPLPAGDVLLFHRPLRGNARPCADLGDGTGLYTARESDLRSPATLGRTWCPSRSPALARSRALLSAAPAEPRVDAAERARVRALLTGLRRQGIRVIVVHSSLAGRAAMRGGEGVGALAVLAGLRVAPPAAVAGLGSDGALLFVRVARRAFPSPCLALDGGASGVYVMRGGELRALEDHPRLACPRR